MCRVERGPRRRGRIGKPLENLGNVQVGALAPGGTELTVEGVLNQSVREPVTLRPLRLFQQPGGGGRLDNVKQVVEVGPRHRGQNLEIEGAPDD